MKIAGSCMSMRFASFPENRKPADVPPCHFSSARFSAPLLDEFHAREVPRLCVRGPTLFSRRWDGSRSVHWELHRTACSRRLPLCPTAGNRRLLHGKAPMGDAANGQAAKEGGTARTFL